MNLNLEELVKRENNYTQKMCEEVQDKQFLFKQLDAFFKKLLNWKFWKRALLIPLAFVVVMTVIDFFRDRRAMKVAATKASQAQLATQYAPKRFNYAKGTYSDMFFADRIDDLTATDDPVFVKINESAEPVLVRPKAKPGTTRKFFTLPPEALGGTVRYMYPDRDFYVVARVPVRS